MNKEITVRKKKKIAENILTKRKVCSRIKTTKEEKTSQTGGRSNEISNWNPKTK